MNLKTIMDVALTFVTPEVVAGLLTLIIALLVKSKVITEKDVATATKMVKSGNALTTITDATKHTMPEVVALAAELDKPDTNRKKIQRIFRKVLRGWLRF